jgi:hypothetical protein
MREHSGTSETTHNHSFFGMRKNFIWYCRDFRRRELRWHMKRVACANDVEIAPGEFYPAR